MNRWGTGLVALGGLLVAGTQAQAHHAVASVYDLNKEIVLEGQLVKLFADDVEKVRAMGVDVHVSDPRELEQWRLATRRVYARWKAQTGAPLLDRIEAVIEKTRKA